VNRALIVIDVQESFRHRPNWPLVSTPDIVDRVNLLVSAARAAGDLVVWVLHTEPDSGTVFDPAIGHVRYLDGLTPEPGDVHVRKTSINAFTTTNLQQQLVKRGVRELVVAGIQTEQCCETTTRVAADLGFTVEFVIDATATFPIPHRNAPTGRTPAEIAADPTTLGVADVMSRTEYALAGRFATIRTVAELAGDTTPAPVG
jgi:nicotinamidase-related amidase